MSRDLEPEARELEHMFDISTEKLKEITEHFTKELTKGLSVDGGNIPMNPTWLMNKPTGYEQGTYLTLDMGGSKARVCQVTLKQKGQVENKQREFFIPKHIKTATANELWDYLAECVEAVVDKEGMLAKCQNDGEHQDDTLRLAFTFSYPVTQDSINHGVLQRWTKGFDVKGVEGQNVVSQLEEALRRKNVPVKVSVLINDTAGTLLASAYADPDTQIGAILGTGCNSAYVETCNNIPKLQHRNLAPDSPMIINCEYGAFDNEHCVLPRTKYDKLIDKESPRPGQQTYEKMTSGLYLGEIFRHAILDLHTRNQLFVGKQVPALSQPYALDCLHLSEVDGNGSSSLQSVLQISLEKHEMDLCQKLADLINARAARLCACGLAAICKKKGLSSCVIGVDGSVMLKNDVLRGRTMKALGEILDWDAKSRQAGEKGTGDTPIRMHFVKDGSSEGAAIAAAIAAAQA
ncbi:hexokinase [Uncinocarpus reesii 1704]|uniref:Phosphotransferase n=1 Tax=Uncinocarpus reesii (strain UAMH 1704) TaxID=336963 RepID=C4JWU8_UNCRE|nr:hexokinase [Uncinocarpus reesii 1704]EEP81256.1 hexokinase [Uncinocarpus reesii 1704]